MRTFNTFFEAIKAAHTDMVRSTPVMRGQWQGTDVTKRPEMRANEITYWGMKVPMIREDLEHYQRQIKPNLPWADDHFGERVGGNPLNPGVEWANWPWGNSAGNFRMDPKLVGDPGNAPIFDHTYAQRYWPRYAGLVPGGIIDHDNMPKRNNGGIYFDYGDLRDVVRELNEDPTTRQAVLPMFFPEDTGYRKGRRKPCSIFYHWQLVDKKLDIVYYLRSCDLVRHFRDDIYLTVRLNLWMLHQLRLGDPGFWNDVKPGNYIMFIGNLHCFANDMPKLLNGELG